MVFSSYIRGLKAAIIGACLLPAVLLVCGELNFGSARIEGSHLAVMAAIGAAGFIALAGLARRAAVFLAGGGLFLAFGLWLGGQSDPGREFLDRLSLPELSVLIPLCAVACALALAGINRARPAFERLAASQSTFVDALSESRLDLAIFGSAALGLFLELAVIRWQTTVFEFFSFYKNFSLLACFAGLGLGYGLAREKSIALAAAAPLLGLQVILMLFLKHVVIEHEMWRELMLSPVTEQLNMGYKTASAWTHFVAVYAMLAVVFWSTALLFAPLGQLAGRFMARRGNLRAYGLNLLGSIAGSLLMLAASHLWTPPAIWFAIGIAGLFAFQVFERAAMVWCAMAGFAVLIALAWPVSFLTERIYSPYQLLERGQMRSGMMEIVAGGHYYQRVYDLSFSNANRETDPTLRTPARHYELPYKIHGSPKSVAIVGAGTGNDVAAAKRMGAERVDAIEIDPAILALGRAYHPERPYGQPGVRSFVNDARTFLRTTDERYDMIVYGLLDSHTLLSHASNVRLDSFVYTVEGLREARERLNEGGVLSLSFAILSEELARKIFLMLQEAFDGQEPLVIVSTYDAALIFLQGAGRKLELSEALVLEEGLLDTTAVYADESISADVSTDDWPFFYMPQRIYPRSYVGLLVLVLGLSALFTAGGGAARPRASDLPFFFLGAGFMLVETKAITELGLAFGNTWQVISIAIIGILAMAFLANWAVAAWKIKGSNAAFALLLAALAVGYAITWRGGFSPSWSGRAMTVLVLTSPMFFSGIVFSSLLRSGVAIGGVMAANLFGAMFGGMLEYNSMYFGFRFLYLLAAGLYVAAWLCHRLAAKSNAPEPVASAHQSE